MSRTESSQREMGACVLCVRTQGRQEMGIEESDTRHTALTVSIPHLTDVSQAEQTPLPREGQAEVSRAVGEAQG